MHGRVTGRRRGGAIHKARQEAEGAQKERQRFDCEVFYARNYSLSGRSFLSVFVLYGRYLEFPFGGGWVTKVLPPLSLERSE